MTNSRDTQEIPYMEGMQMMKIFSEKKSESSLFDEFEEYDEKEKNAKNRKVYESGKNYYDTSHRGGNMGKRGGRGRFQSYGRGGQRGYRGGGISSQQTYGYPQFGEQSQQHPGSSYSQYHHQPQHHQYQQHPQHHQHQQHPLSMNPHHSQHTHSHTQQPQTQHHHGQQENQLNLQQHSQQPQTLAQQQQQQQQQDGMHSQTHVRMGQQHAHGLVSVEGDNGIIEEQRHLQQVEQTQTQDQKYIQ